MIANEIRIACPVGLEVPSLEVDEEFTLEVRVRVAGVRRDTVDVSSASGPATLPAGISLDLIAIPVDGWPEPAPLPPDYRETAG